jgi:hypothetical protein
VTGRGFSVAPLSDYCTIPDILDQLRVSDPPWIDDGKIGADVFLVSERDTPIHLKKQLPCKATGRVQGPGTGNPPPKKRNDLG